MELTRLQWIVAFCAAAGIHLLVLAGAWLAILPAQSPEKAPRGVMVSLDSFDAGPPPTADTAPPVPAKTSAPERAEPQVPEASTAPAPAAQIQAAAAPEPAPQIGPEPASRNNQGDSAAANKQAAKPPTAPAVTIRPSDITSDIAPQEQTVARNIAPEPAPPSDNTGNGNGAYGNSDTNTNDYIIQLRAWLARHKQYPDQARRDGLQGTVRLYLVVDQNGHVVRHRIQHSSGSPLLDQAAQQMLERSEPLPRMPARLQRNRLELVIPIAFTLQ